MTNLAKTIKSIAPYEKNHVIYGYFDHLPDRELRALQQNNKRSQYRASCLAGILLGLKLFFSSMAGLLLASLLIQLPGGISGMIPPFFLLLLWLACAGTCFCTGNICSRLISVITGSLFSRSLSD